MPNVIASPQGESKWFKGLGEPTAFDDKPDDRAWTVDLLLDKEMADVFKGILKEYFVEPAHAGFGRPWHQNDC